MPTANVTVTNAWTKVADDTDDPVCIQCTVDADFELASSATEEAPTVRGNPLNGRGDVGTRATVGSGFIYARLTAPAQTTSAVFVVNT